MARSTCAAVPAASPVWVARWPSGRSAFWSFFPSQPSSSPAVAAELIAFSLLGAFDATYGRLIWDDVYGLTDVLSTNLWLFLAVQAAMRGEIDLGSRLLRYGDLVEEIAHSELTIASLFGDS